MTPELMRDAKALLEKQPMPDEALADFVAAYTGKPRRMRQPTKGRLREALTDAADRIESQGAEILQLKEQLVGEGKAALGGLVVGILVGWVFL